jgi:competence protein ComEA
MNTSWLDRNRHVVFIISSIIALGGAVGFYLWQPVQNPIEILPPEATATPAPTLAPPPTATPTPAPVRVYVTGAVVNSDVYFLPRGSIIKDAVKAAGGFTPDADPERINQAQELKDQQQIHIPRLGEENPPPLVQGGQGDSNEGGRGGSAVLVSGGVINLNTATLEQLDTLPGIGPAIAQRIVDYRETIGGFTSIDEITQVSGIGEATFAKIKNSITVE